jgi:3-isopropylmalate/(R)-2-methylmalate dehydratase small subunit
MSEHQRITTIEGTALPLAGDAIDTDRIIPARYLRTVSFEGLERHVFEDDRSAALTAGRSEGPHPFDDPRYAGASVLLVGRNFGCGSSREHAPQALYRWGIRAIVGESFSDIFFGNSALIGLPCVTAARAALDELMAIVAREPSRAVRVNLETLSCTSNGFLLPIEMPANTRDAFVTGAWDTTGMLLERYDEVRRVAARLPYISGFTTSPRPA